MGLLIFALAIELKKRFPKTFDKFAANVAVKAMDKTSFHVYLVHGVFCMGATNIYKLVPNLWLATALFFAATVASTILLYNAERLALKILRAYKK